MKKKINSLDDYPITAEPPSKKRAMRELIEWEIKHRGMVIDYLPDEVPPKKYTAQVKEVNHTSPEEEE